MTLCQVGAIEHSNKMEVTKGNFDAVFSRLEKDLKNAQFVAVDTEFTGLKVEGASGLNYYDTLEDLYLKDRLRAETFMAIQVGLVMFYYKEETDEYSHLGYNFYVYPSSCSDVNFTCQSKSIQFLVEHGFDFNKLFKSGIPYLKDSEADKLIEKLTEKYEKNSKYENSTKMEIPTEHQKTISDIISKIQDIIQLKGKMSFTTEKYNSYIRRLIYSSVQNEFGSTVFLESNKDETMTISVGLTAEEMSNKQKEKYTVQKNKILSELGFSRVIKLLVESKKLLVGHNLFLDILFLIKQFLVPLPESYSEFKELSKFIFPSIIDTKHMAATEIKNVKDTSLSTLVEYFENSNMFPEVQVHEGGVGYKIEDRKLHEASYDAYLTGLCFLAMAKHSGKKDIFKDLPNSSFIEPFLNKLSTPRLCDIFFMNLGGLDNEPDRQGVYHLTFPKDWTRDNILLLFKDFGFINIAWINDTSAFVKVKKEFIKDVEKNLMFPNEKFKLLTHSKFKSINSSASIQANTVLETNIQNSMNAESLILKLKSSEPIKKRKIEEDIGEVIERPKKKSCSK